MSGERPDGDPGPHVDFSAELDEPPVGAAPSPSGHEDAELLPASGPLRRVLQAIGLVEQAIGASLIVVILVLVLIQVAQRYLPGGGWPWTGEVARLAFVWCTFILSGYLMAEDRHITIKVIDLVLSRRPLGVLKLMVHLFVAVTCIALAYASYRLIADDIGQRTPAAEIPLALVYVLPMVGFALTALRAALAIGLLDIPEITGREETAQ